METTSEFESFIRFKDTRLSRMTLMSSSQSLSNGTNNIEDKKWYI